jgi:head-tail adaptor
MTIVAGNFRKVITIYRLTQTQDVYGAPVNTYNPVMTLKAQLVTEKGNMTLTNYEVFSASVKTFQTYYRNILNTDRIQYENKMYKILDMSEIGQREQWKLVCQLMEGQ